MNWLAFVAVVFAGGLGGAVGWLAAVRAMSQRARVTDAHASIPPGPPPPDGTGALATLRDALEEQAARLDALEVRVGFLPPKAAQNRA